MVLLFCLGLSVFSKKNPPVPETKPLEPGLSEITIGNSKLYVEKATSDEERSRGLSGRTELGANRGMMFVFPTSGTKFFWMKDTLIPLDIIWVANNIVVGTDHMFTELDTSLSLVKHYISPSPVDTVIETNLNWTTNNNINVGDKVLY